MCKLINMSSSVAVKMRPIMIGIRLTGVANFLVLTVNVTILDALHPCVNPLMSSVPPVSIYKFSAFCPQSVRICVYRMVLTINSISRLGNVVETCFL
jgi:hypothetical protein